MLDNTKENVPRWSNHILLSNQTLKENIIDKNIETRISYLI